MSNPVAKIQDDRPIARWKRPEIVGAILATIVVLGVVTYIAVDWYVWYRAIPKPPPQKPVDIWGPTGGFAPAALGDNGLYELASGTAEFTLINGVDIFAEGACRFTLHDPMTCTLHNGVIMFTCPPEAQGYTVRTDLNDVRVIGRAGNFSISVVDSEVELHLFEGSVFIQHGSTPMALDAPAAVRISSLRTHQVPMRLQPPPK